MILKLKRSEKAKSVPLLKEREAAKLTVVNVTEKVRSSFLTPITGQGLTYKEKEEQAIAFLQAETEPKEAGPAYGFVFGEVGITAETPYQVAMVILYKADFYRAQIGPAIERLRLLANVNIEQAVSIEEVKTAVEEFTEDMELLAT